ANLASGGVTGGALVIVGEDYGEGSSIMQERTHAFAMKSQIWLLDPKPNLESLVKAVEDGFLLSEASHTPVILQMRIRGCHVHGRFTAKDNQRPAMTLSQALDNPVRDVDRIVLPPASFLHEQEKIRERWPAAVDFITRHQLNEFVDGDLDDIGLILQGGLYNGVIRSLQLLGLADHFGNTRIPLYVMNVTYPVVDAEIDRFCHGKKAVLLLEEGQPNYLEQALNTILRQRGSDTVLAGKDVLPMAGEYTTAVMRDGLRTFLDKHCPTALRNQEADAGYVAAHSNATTAGASVDHVPTEGLPAGGAHDRQNTDMMVAQVARRLDDSAPPKADPLDLKDVVPARPAGFCTGCPERPIFSALTLAQESLGERHIAGDIGCHLFSILPPFNLGATTMGYGLGAASAAAFGVRSAKRPIAIMGDGGFWHNGLSSGVGNAVFNKYDGVILIIDNYYTSATGGQDILSSRALNRRRDTGHPIEKAVRGVGVDWVRRVDRTYDVTRMRAVIEEALTTQAPGPKVIIAQSECMLNRQRREKPAFRKAVGSGRRAVKERLGVDADVCNGDHACIRLSGCPSLTVRDSGDPLKEDPVAYIDNSCAGCGNCGEVAVSAILCPSFYKARVIHNPGRWDRFVQAVRHRVIHYLQQRRQARLDQIAI
ncbi:MAG TPA: indolepyruvate ferredoxin oxidoreductase subunit alpha, partial [Burkholderiaceae bacterium]|nr:indolepyruvate ferredoxin oxidoreductase subunit alpha [Burkholderiaceae bacterium]